ncbi:hypothetical protein Ngar_c08380 [Candidatus Nitrososphaera gargensis Ga9.2]|uniref:Uncharacterized protein n=1 Tax=Nitrososphaera gargensis (strain Ga9.2) TaxID=1237085 RepID=K0IDL9_NITGG|nr:hypothetical protein Ngar_c08380 [Candidatus Nitrososphaera gargensis Ga9.2]
MYHHHSLDAEFGSTGDERNAKDSSSTNHKIVRANTGRLSSRLTFRTYGKAGCKGDPKINQNAKLIARWDECSQIPIFEC